MRFILLFFIFSHTSFAKYPFTPKDEEIGKTKTYTLNTPELPLKFQNLWTKSEFNIYKNVHFSNKVKKSYSDKVNLFTWTIFVHEDYNVDIPSGILLLSTNFNYNEPPIAFKKLCKEYNLILIAPDLSKESQHGIYSLELSISALDLIRQRYKINNNRIFYVAFGNKINHEAHFHSPHLFTGIFGIRSQVGWDEKEFKKAFGKTKYKKFLNTLKDKHFFLLESPPKANDIGFENGRVIYEDNYFHSSLEKNKVLYSSNFFNTEKSADFSTGDLKKFSSTINHINEELFLDLPLNALSRSFQFLDTKSLEMKETYFNEGVKFEQNEIYPKALVCYQNAYKLSHPKAKSRIRDIVDEIKRIEFTAIKSFTQKNYYEAYKTARSLTINYPNEYVKYSKLILEKIKADKDIINEIKAAIFLSKAQAALKQTPVPKDKIKAVCEKVIKTVPGTNTAEKAQKILDSLK